MAVTSSLLLLEEENDVPFFSRSQQSYIDSISSHPNPKADDDDDDNDNNSNDNDNDATIFTWDDDDNNNDQQKAEGYESATVTTTSTTLSRSQQRKNKRRSKKNKKKKSKSQHSLDHLKQQVSTLMRIFEEYGWFIPMPDNDSTSAGNKVWSNRMYGADKKKQRKQNERQMLECRIVQLETVLRDDHDHDHDHDHDCATIVELTNKNPCYGL